MRTKPLLNPASLIKYNNDDCYPNKPFVSDCTLCFRSDQWPRADFYICTTIFIDKTICATAGFQHTNLQTSLIKHISLLQNYISPVTTAPISATTTSTAPAVYSDMTGLSTFVAVTSPATTTPTVATKSTPKKDESGRASSPESTTTTASTLTSWGLFNSDTASKSTPDKKHRIVTTTACGCMEEKLKYDIDQIWTRSQSTFFYFIQAYIMSFFKTSICLKKIIRTHNYNGFTSVSLLYLLSIHILDGILGISRISILHKGKAWRVSCDPYFLYAAKYNNLMTPLLLKT